MPLGGAVTLYLVLADAELELVPESIAGHPAVRKHAQGLGRRPTEILLDQNWHAAAASKLEEGKRRGRPDITQLCLLTLLESPLCKAGQLQVAIHTRNGDLVRIRPDTRLPRGEQRLQGLLSKVLREGATQDKDPLLWLEGKQSAAEVLESFARGPVFRLDEAGEAVSPLELAERANASGNLTLVLGAFPSGGFSSQWAQAAQDAVSIWPEALNAWAVAGECVAAFRARHGPVAPPA